MKEKGITLIALVITIIVLLILAGISIAMLVGEDGIMTRATWAKWLTEYRTVEEAERLYEIDENMKEYGDINKKVTSRAGEERTSSEEGDRQIEKNKYAITSEKVTVVSGTTLESTIKEINGENYVGELYKIDKEKLKLKDIEKEYALDIKNGKIYDIKGHKRGGTTYHIPEIGVKNGTVVEIEDTEAPSNFTIDARYNENEEQLEIKVGEVKDNQSTTFKYEYHIKEVTVNEETNEVTETLTPEIVKTTTGNTYYDGEIGNGTYKIYVVVYDNSGNSRKSDNEEIVTIEVLEQVTTIDSLTINDPVVVKIGKTATVEVIKNEGADDETKVSNKSFNWSIADNNVATVNQKGQITGQTNDGTTTTVTATLKSDTTQEITATVKVKNLITDIWTKEDLKQFRDEVNSGSNYSGLEVNQRADIELGREQWEPIGISKKLAFMGSYNGNGNEITGLYINTSEACQGLFGYARGGAEIKNVNVKDGEITTTAHTAGGIVGWGNNIVIDNCTFSGSVTTTGQNSLKEGNTGGIIGCAYIGSYNKISNCRNDGTITSDYNFCGGIVGEIFNGKIEGCINNGEIIGYNRFIAGIAGWIGDKATKSNVQIEKCINYAKISGKSSRSSAIGGITGASDWNDIIRYCGNIGNITCEGEYTKDVGSYAGGIIGLLRNVGNRTTIQKCYNTGDITTTYSSTGGIAGVLRSGHTIKECYNIGTISAKSNAGGIIGWRYSGNIGDDCYYLENNTTVNSGSVTANGIESSESDIKNLINVEMWKEFLVQDKNPNINKGYPIFNWQ